MTDASQLEPSPTWRDLSAKIGRQLEAGVPFADIHEMNIVIAQRTLAPYQAHRRRLDETIWADDPGPKTIVDLGAGYGAMASVWPAGAHVYNLDLPEMLVAQGHYIAGPDWTSEGREFGSLTFDLVPIAQADRIPWAGAYLFSTWALTETTMPMWRYIIERAPQLAGAYVLGYKRWVDEKEAWPWADLVNAFLDIRVYRDVDPDSLELAAVNRMPAGLPEGESDLKDMQDMEKAVGGPGVVAP